MSGLVTLGEYGGIQSMRASVTLKVLIECVNSLRISTCKQKPQV